jgi:hypothetical protein
MRNTTTDAIASTIVALLAIAWIAGDPTDTATDWLIRGIIIYPFTHLAWRGVRYRHRTRRPR